MGTALVKIKIMPSSPDTDREELKKKVETIISEADGKSINFEEEPVAFGLVAVIAGFSWNEEISTNETEEKLRAIEDVSSAEVIDFRRAFG